MQPQTPTPNPAPTVSMPTPTQPQKPSFWSKLTAFRHWSRRRKLVTLLLLIIIAAGVWFGFSRNKSTTDQSAQNIASASTTVASPLTGEQVNPEAAQRPVTAVMIENSTDARPQSGLQAAGVVFEAEAEGGITRFMALFQEATPQYIGPVRSLRPYYLDWADGFHAAVAHVGGSPTALAKVRSAGQRDLDEFFNANSYWRISSRFAPHNVYTSFAKLDALNKAKGFKFESFTTWPRKADAPMATPTAKTVNLSLSGYDYDVSYHYDSKTNTYYRYEGHAVHTDTTASGKVERLHPNVVIAMVVSLKPGKLDASGAYYSDYSDIGKGVTYVFQDGGVTKGTWIKKSANSQLTFIDSKGNPIALNAGQTWITAVSGSSAITHSAQ